MKNLIKNYRVPKVNPNVLSVALKNIKSLSTKKEQEENITFVKNNYILILSCIFASVFLVFFMKSLIELNLSYIDVLLSSLNSIGIFLVVILNLIIWTFYFMYQNILSIIMLVFLYYFWVLYIYERQREKSYL